MLAENNKLSLGIAELKYSVKNNEVTKMKEEMTRQCKYITSLEKQIASLTNVTKMQKELKVLQASSDNIEQYSRKNSLELHGISTKLQRGVRQSYTYTQQHMRLKKVMRECNSAAHTIKTSTGFKRFIEQKA